MITYDFDISPDQFSVSKTFLSGQCFRWVSNDTEDFTGIVLNHIARVWRDGDKLMLGIESSDLLNFWEHYLRLDTLVEDIAAVKNIVYRCNTDRFLQHAFTISTGIAILRQPFFETLISYIISQRNNIPRIISTVDLLAKYFGVRFDLPDFEQYGLSTPYFYSFPHLLRMSGLSCDDLEPLRLGYRDIYILESSKLVLSSLPLSKLANLTTHECLQVLQKLPGVGPKVANCVVLYALDRLDGFPMDVWMDRISEKYYEGVIDEKIYGAYAGWIQQYMFYAERTHPLLQ